MTAVRKALITGQDGSCLAHVTETVIRAINCRRDHASGRSGSNPCRCTPGENARVVDGPLARLLGTESTIEVGALLL